MHTYRRPGSLRYLLARREMRPAVLLPAGFVLLGTLRAFLAVADGLETVTRNAKADQEILSGAGAAVAQPEVVLGRTALIAVAFHHDRSAGEIGQDALERSRVARQCVARVGADVALVIVEISVLHVAQEPLFQGLGDRRRRWWRRRRRSRHVDRGCAGA